MRKLLSFLLCLFLGIGLAAAQTTKVSGVVISAEDGEPIIGASVVGKGTTTGTVTNFDGRFELMLEKNIKTLVVSYVGMKTEEVGVKPSLRIVLSPASEELDEVVVVAYGTVRREAKTGAVTQVKSDQIVDVPASSVDKMLAGKLAGVSITSSSGQPGASSNIRIRGTSSINAGNEPLYVVDGIAVMNGDQGQFTNTSNAIAMINPNDIESITVLKDAAAASVYGSRAANGVILVTTKSGKEGKTALTARAKFGISSLANDNDFGVMNPTQLVSYMRDAVVNAGRNPDDPSGGTYYVPWELATRPQTNWVDAVSRNGNMQEYELTASGGTPKASYYNSLSYHRNEGVYYGVDFQKFQFRSNLDYDISKLFRFGTRINAGYMKSNDVPMQDLYYSNPAFASMLILPWTPLKNPDGTYNLDISENSNQNPVATATYDDQWEKQYRFNGNFYLQCTPMEGLTIKTTNSAEIMSGEGRRYWDPRARYNKDLGTLQTTTTLYRLLTTSNTINYQKTIGEHNGRVLIGQEATKDDATMNYLYSPDVSPEMPYPPTSTTEKDQGDYSFGEETLLSFFGILDYSYASKYFLQASVRRDGSSVFGENRRWGTFYSVGLSWNIHNEAFMKDFTFLDMLKLRATYGKNGNNNIKRYSQFGVYSPNQYNGVSGLQPSRPANPDLSWEMNTSYNVGLDFGFLNIFNGSIDWYTRKTTDMLLDTPVSGTSGFTKILQNIGAMRNTGIEFQLDADIIKGREWQWNVGLNLAHNKSKILDLGNEEQMAYSEDSRLYHVKGKGLFTYYLFDYAGVNPVNGEALWYTEDGSTTNNYSKARRIFKGSPEPKLTGGFNTSLSWKGLNLSAFFEYKVGNEVLIIENRYITSDGYNWGSNQSKTALNYWKNPGDTNCLPKPIANNSTNSSSFTSTRYLEKGDYLRIKDITLSYTLPKDISKKAGLNNVRIYGSGLNLYTFHDVNFWDPERGIDGLGYGIYPMTKTFVIGLDVTF